MRRRGGGLSEGVRSPADRRAVRVGRPEAEVGEELFDDHGLVYDRDGPHRSPTLGTEQRINLINLLDEMGPALL